MDIGLLCDTYPFELDGVGMVVKNYAKELTDSGCRCCMVVPKAPREGADGIAPCELLQYRGLSLPAAKQYRAGVPYLDFSYLRKQRNVSMDILHAHSPFGAGIEALRLSRILDVPLVGTFHSKYYDDFYAATRSRTLSQAGVKMVVSFFNACDEVWTVSEASKKVLRDYGYEHDIIVMPNGTDACNPSSVDEHRARESFRISGRGPVLLYVGQQHWKKNLRHIIQALSLFRAESADFCMVMAGQGPDEEEIKALVCGLGLDKNFVFTGQILDRSLLMGLYACSDLLIFPSLYDTAGLVVQEAAAAKTPALVAEGSCAAECIKDGYNGFLCENSPAGIYAALSGILADERKLRRVGEAASKTIPVSWHDVIGRVRTRYEMLIENYDMRAIDIEGGANGLFEGKSEGKLESKLEERIERLLDTVLTGKSK